MIEFEKDHPQDFMLDKDLIGLSGEELKKALEGSDVEEIEKKTNELKDVAMKMSSKVYEEAAKASQASQTAESSETNKDEDKKDDVQEAKYEEK